MYRYVCKHLKRCLEAQGITGKNVGSAKNVHLYYKCLKQPH